MVDLPQPDAPTKATILPDRMVASMPRRTLILGRSGYENSTESQTTSVPLAVGVVAAAVSFSSVS